MTARRFIFLRRIQILGLWQTLKGKIVAIVFFIGFVIYLGYWHTESIDCKEGFAREQGRGTSYDYYSNTTSSYSYTYYSYGEEYQGCLNTKLIPSFEQIQRWWEDGIDFVGEPEGSKLN